MLDPEIAVQLRNRGWDVVSIQREHGELIGLDAVLKGAAGPSDNACI